MYLALTVAVLGFVLAVAGLGLLFDQVPVRALPLVMLPIFAALALAAWINDYGPDAPAQGSRESLRDSFARPGVPRFIASAFQPARRGRWRARAPRLRP